MGVLVRLLAAALLLLLLSLASAAPAQQQPSPQQQQPSIAVSSVSLTSLTSYQWTVAKSTPSDTISISQGGTGSATYTVTYSQTALPPEFAASGQVVVRNPTTQQLQLAEVVVQAQWWAAGNEGPVAADVACPPGNSIAGMFVVNGAVPGSAVATMVCNYTIALPTSDPGYMVAEASFATGQPPLVSAAANFSAAGVRAADASASPGLCALVNDTFDPASYQKLGPPKVTAGAKPPRDGEPPAKVCSNATYVYTASWTVGSADACGSYLVESTAAANPIGGTQQTQAETVWLEVDACNSQEVPVPAPALPGPTAATAAPQVTVSVTSTSGGGTSYSWGVSSSVGAPAVQVARGGNASVSFTTAFTRSAASQSSPLTLSGSVIVTNPTSQPMEVADVEVGWMVDGGPAPVNLPAACETGAGGSVLVGANKYVTCLFSFPYPAGQTPGMMWAQAVTSTGAVGVAPQVVVDPSSPAVTPTPVAACAVATGGFEGGAVGLLQPSGFLQGSQLPPGFAGGTGQQLCGSQVYSYTAVFGPLNKCGKMQAVAQATVDPVGGQQASQSASMAVSITVLC